MIEKLRTGSDDLVVYKPFLTDSPSEELAGLKFLKEANHVLPKIPTTSDDWQSGPRPLRVLPNISGCSSVFIPGSSAGFVFRTSATSPHFIRLRGDYTKGLGCFSSPDKGFAYLDSDVRYRPSLRYITLY